MKILYVEDKESFLRTMGYMVAHLGHTLITARNGREGLDKVDASTDLLLLDLNLPDIDGFTVARQVRVRWPSLPIIAVTSYATPDVPGRCLEAGCTEFIAKPLLLDAVSALLNRYTPAIE